SFPHLSTELSTELSTKKIFLARESRCFSSAMIWEGWPIVEISELRACIAARLLGENIRGLDRNKRAGYYKAQIWDDSRAVRGVFTAIDRFEYILKGSY